MRGLLPGTALALLLAGCSPAAPDKPTEGAAQKARMDLATKAYADCITAMTAEAAVDVDAAGTIANRVVLACKDKRNALLADVIAFHQIGHPKFSIDQSKAVAEASIATIEDELRRETVVTIISRQTGGGKAANAVAPTPLD
jgi:hypothetical protein